MNRIFPIILAVVLSGCSNSEVTIEKCADSMFMLTNELMKKRMPTEAKSTEAILGFTSNTYSEKKKYEFYLALIKICELEHSKNPEKFNLKYK